MAFDINWNKSSASQIAAQVDAAKAALMKSASPTTNSGTSVLRDAYDSRNNNSSSSSSSPWQSSNPIGIANSAPSAVTQKATNNSATGLPSWMGNMYSQVPGTDWYSTNASNPNASKYRADGSPVASVGFDYTATGGNKFDGYASPEQFKQIMDMNNSGALSSQGGQQSLASLLQGWANSGQLTSNDSIYKNGLTSDPRTSLSSVYAPPPPSTSRTMTPTAGYTKNPSVDALPIDQQIAYYKANPAEAQQEIARAEGIGGSGAMGWANQLKSSLSAPGSQQSAQAYINDQTSGQGGLSNYVAMQQAKWDQAQAQGDTDMISRLNADMARVGYKLNTGTAQNNVGTGGTGTGMGAGVGTGTGQQTAADLIKSMYDSNYASQSQAIKSSRDLMLAGLAGKEGQINQSTTANLNSNDVMANQRMQQLREAMANAGLSASGDNVSAQVGLGNSQQQGATDINNNKTNQLSDLLAQRNAINNNASADDLALLQQLQAQRDGLLLNQSNADRTFNYNAGQDQIKNDRQTKTDNWNAYMDSVGLTGNLGTGAKADWGLLGGTDGEMTLDAKTKYLQQEGIKVNNELAKIQLADYPAEQKLKMQQLQKQIAEIGKAPYQSAVDVEYDKIKLDTAKKQLKILQEGKTPTPAKPTTAEDFAKYIDSTPGAVTKDQYTGKENVDKTAVEKMIVTSSLSETEMYKLYQRYGLKWDGPVPTGK